MPFLKKSHTVEEKLDAINVRISELTKKRDSKAKDIAERKTDCSRFLATLAMGDDSKAEESLKLARRGLERLNESLSDLNTQIVLLQEQKGKLAIEFKQARLRDIPPLLDEKAKGFNTLLAEALKQAEVLKNIHGRMAETEQQFKNLFSEHGKICGELCVVQPLDLQESFGGPSFADIRFSLPGISVFLGSLLGYRASVEGRSAFLKANPNMQRDLAATREMDFENGKIRPMILPRQF